jgi:hypothetical protein
MSASLTCVAVNAGIVPGIVFPCDVVNFTVVLTLPARTMAVMSAIVIV